MDLLLIFTLVFFTSCQVHSSSEFGRQSSTNYEEKFYRKQAAHYKLQKDTDDETMYKLIGVIMTNMNRTHPEWFDQPLNDCLKNATSIQMYTTCLLPLIEKKQALLFKENQNLLRSKRLKRSIVRRRKKPVASRIDSAQPHAEAADMVAKSPPLKEAIATEGPPIDNQVQRNKPKGRKRVYKVKRRKMKKIQSTTAVQPKAELQLATEGQPQTKVQQKTHVQPKPEVNEVELSIDAKGLQQQQKIPVSSVQAAKSFTLVPADSDGVPQTTTEHLPIMKDIGEFLLDTVRHIKTEQGSIFKMPDIDKIPVHHEHASSSNDSLNGRIPLSNGSQISINLTALMPVVNEIFSAVDTLMNSPLMVLRKDVNLNEDSVNSFNIDQPSSDNFRLLSPRFLPFVQKQDPSILSPDILSLYEGSDPDNVASVPSLLSNLGISKPDRLPWLQFLGEISGATDIVRSLDSPEFKKILARTHINSSDGSTTSVAESFDFVDGTVQNVYRILKSPQLSKLNSDGYAFLNDDQLTQVYGDRKSTLEMDIGRYSEMNAIERELSLLDTIVQLSRPKANRAKRQNALPCILTPYSGGTVLMTYLLAPQIICPSVFSFIVLGPLVLSPYILSPYVFGPFILSPEVLTPFVLSPYVLSPTILSPPVLSPGVLNPIVLSPYILSPFVLSPSVLSPTVLNPNILSPNALGPSVLSPTALSPNVLGPGVLTPAILSPIVLGPSILSPSVLAPSILNPTVLSPSILSPGLLNPSIKSPGVLSPAILSPCSMCKKRKKRDLFIQWLINDNRYFL